MIMSDLALLANHTNGTEKLEMQSFDLPQNYSLLINKLEQLALGLDSAFGNLSLDRKQFEIAVSGNNGNVVSSGGGSSNGLGLSPAHHGELLYGTPIVGGRLPSPHPAHGGGMNDMEYSRVMSDIWIGVVLTLLIVSVIFFICSCFLYHKFQQWKNSYRGNPNDPVEICRHMSPDFEGESLPSYTIVSGLPTYDDALEEFRKAGIILTPPMMPMIKIFETDTKDNSTVLNMENTLNGDGDNISIGSTCTCGGAITAANTAANATTLTPNSSSANLNLNSQVIELNPEQLAHLSQKRLSLQIAFGGGTPNMARRNSRPRFNLSREVNRNNFLRSRAVGFGTNNSVTNNNSNTNNNSSSGRSFFDNFPQLHRSSSSGSLNMVSTPSCLDARLAQHLQHHRGSLY